MQEYPSPWLWLFHITATVIHMATLSLSALFRHSSLLVYVYITEVSAKTLKESTWISHYCIACVCVVYRCVYINAIDCLLVYLRALFSTTNLTKRSKYDLYDIVLLLLLSTTITMNTVLPKKTALRFLRHYCDEQKTSNFVRISEWNQNKESHRKRRALELFIWFVYVQCT